MTAPVVAVLHQAVAPPVWDSARKPPKPGGYQDSGADIAWTLRQAGQRVVTADPDPSPAVDAGWTFPDTSAGIAAAMSSGTTILWANTVIWRDHPLAAVLGQGAVVGQAPAMTGQFDDKAVTNQLLAAHGLPVVPHALITATPDRTDLIPRTSALITLDEPTLAAAGLDWPLVVKPVRGRGSAGVTVVVDLAELRATAAALIATGDFGATLMLEPFLPGDEITVTVMPLAGRPMTIATGPAGYWALPPVRRFNHQAGVAPYNGTVAVVRNSQVLSSAAGAEPAVQAIVAACVAAAALQAVRAPIRIDCRQQSDGEYRLFDLNLKPNMTGPGRPGREDQLSLSGIAAAGLDLTYSELLPTMLAGAWI